MSFKLLDSYLFKKANYLCWLNNYFKRKEKKVSGRKKKFKKKVVLMMLFTMYQINYKKTTS